MSEKRDGFSAIRGKCLYWRETLDEEDRFDTRIKKEDWRVECTCFIEGTRWPVTASAVPDDCPEKLHCRYYIYNG